VQDLVDAAERARMQAADDGLLEDVGGRRPDRTAASPVERDGAREMIREHLLDSGSLALHEALRARLLESAHGGDVDRSDGEGDEDEQDRGDEQLDEGEALLIGS